MAKFLPEICKIQYGFPFDSKKFSLTEGVPLIRIRDITRGYSETYTTQEYDEDFLVYENDLLIGMDGEFNIAKWGKTPALLNQRVCRLIPSDQVEKNYLFYYMPSALKRIEEKTPFVTVKHLSAKELNKIQVPLPPISEQRRIASILDKVTDLIAKRRSQLEKLDLLVKSRFVEMFGVLGTDQFGWGLKKLGQCCEINPKKANDLRLQANLEVSFVPMTAVSENGIIDTSDSRKYDDVKSGFTYFSEEDVLFAKITPCMENGKGAVAKKLKNGIGFGSTEFHVLRPIYGVSDCYWLYVMSIFSEFRKEAELKMTGSAGQRRVPVSFLEEYKVALPPIELQKQFASFVQQTETTKANIQKSLETLETLKKALMQHFFKQ